MMTKYNKKHVYIFEKNYIKQYIHNTFLFTIIKEAHSSKQSLL